MNGGPPGQLLKIAITLTTLEFIAHLKLLWAVTAKPWLVGLPDKSRTRTSLFRLRRLSGSE